MSQCTKTETVVEDVRAVRVARAATGVSAAAAAAYVGWAAAGELVVERQTADMASGWEL